MSVIRIANQQLQLDILPEAGASLVALNANLHGEWIGLTRPTPPEAIESLNPSLLASFTMAPWCNRIQAARFPFAGQEIVLQPATPEGYAMHGDGRKRPWRVVEQTATQVTCTLDSRHFADYNYPFPLTLKVQYMLQGNAFHTHIWLTNVGESAMPAGFGFHPYFNRTFANRGADEANVQFGVGGLYPPMPSGPMVPLSPEHNFSQLKPLGSAVIDAVYGGWDGRARIVYPQAGVAMNFSCSGTLRHLCFFTPAGKAFFALEPLSHGLNGFNLAGQGQAETGVQVLEPGQTMEGTFTISVTE